MARRTTATLRRPSPHPWRPDPDDPIVCRYCRCPERNTLHQLPTTTAEARAYDARVLDEHQED